jgi:hypothetical protein
MNPAARCARVSDVAVSEGRLAVVGCLHVLAGRRATEDEGLHGGKIDRTHARPNDWVKDQREATYSARHGDGARSGILPPPRGGGGGGAGRHKSPERSILGLGDALTIARLLSRSPATPTRRHRRGSPISTHGQGTARCVSGADALWPSAHSNLRCIGSAAAPSAVIATPHPCRWQVFDPPPLRLVWPSSDQGKVRAALGSSFLTCNTSCVANSSSSTACCSIRARPLAVSHCRA